MQTIDGTIDTNFFKPLHDHLQNTRETEILTIFYKEVILVFETILNCILSIPVGVQYYLHGILYTVQYCNYLTI